MVSPRFEPRSFTPTPRRFGRSNHLVWPQVDGQRESLQRASAILQHQFSYLVREGLGERGTTLKQYTTDLGLDYRRMSRILCGEIVMKLEDVMLASRYLGFTLMLERKGAARPDALARSIATPSSGQGRDAARSEQ